MAIVGIALQFLVTLILDGDIDIIVAERNGQVRVLQKRCKPFIQVSPSFCEGITGKQWKSIMHLALPIRYHVRLMVQHLHRGGSLMVQDFNLPVQPPT